MPVTSDGTGSARVDELRLLYSDLQEDESDSDDSDPGNPNHNEIHVENPAAAEMHSNPVLLEPMEYNDSQIEGSWFRPNAKRRLDRTERLSNSSDAAVSSKKKKSTPLVTSSNKSQLSNGNMTVLVAQDLHSRDSLFGSTEKRFTQDPVALSEGLTSALDKEVVKEIRPNKRRNIVAVEFKESACTQMKEFLSLMALGPFAIRCYQPVSNASNLQWGVIDPIHEDVDVSKLLPIIVCDGDTRAVQVYRLHKYSSGRKELSKAVKIGFSGSALPHSVKIDVMSFTVRPFRKPPLRCFRCQRQGHMSGGCTAVMRCLICAQNHSKESCTATSPCCANCGGAHVASFGNCPFNLEAVQISELVQKGMSVRLARQTVSGRAQREPQQQSASVLPWESSQQLLTLEEERPSTCISSAPQSLQTHEVAVDVHQSQGSYIIPRRYPRRPISYASAVSSPPPAPVSPLPVSQSDDIPSTEMSLTKKCEERILQTCTAQVHHICETKFSSLIENKFKHHISESYQRQGEILLDKCQELITASISSLFSKLGELFIELFSLNLFSEGKRERRMLLLGMIRNHFGAEISDPLLERFSESSTTLNKSAPAPTPGKVPNPSSTGSRSKKQTPATRSSTKKR